MIIEMFKLFCHVTFLQRSTQSNTAAVILPLTNSWRYSWKQLDYKQFCFPGCSGSISNDIYLLQMPLPSKIVDLVAKEIEHLKQHDKRYLYGPLAFFSYFSKMTKPCRHSLAEELSLAIIYELSMVERTKFYQWPKTA